MNEVLQVAKMVLLPEQRAFIVKQYYEIHSLKHIRDDFIQEFPNSVCLSNHTILNLTKKKKVQSEHSLNDLLWLGHPPVVTSERREVISNNVIECLATLSQ